MDCKENILPPDLATDEFVKESKFLIPKDQESYIPSELTSDIGVDFEKWTFPIQDDYRYIFVYDESLKVRIFGFAKNHGKPAYRCLGCRFSDIQKNLIRNCTWPPGDPFPSAFVPPHVDTHVCQSLTEEEAKSRLAAYMKEGCKSTKQQKESTIMEISNDTSLTPEPNSARFSVLDKHEYLYVYDEELKIRVFRFYRFFNKKIGYRCTGCGALNKNLVRYCTWPEGNALPESFSAPKTEDHICQGMTVEEAESKVKYLIDFNNGIRGKKRARENENSEQIEKKKPRLSNSRNSKQRSMAFLMDMEPGDGDSDVTSANLDTENSMNMTDSNMTNSNPDNSLVESSTSRRKSVTNLSVSFASQYEFPIPNDERFVIISAGETDKYWAFRLQYKRQHAYYSCLKCLKLKRFVSFGVTNGIDQVKEFTRKEEHTCEPMEKREAQDYCSQVASIAANKKESGNEEARESHNDRRFSRNESVSITEVYCDGYDKNASQVRLRVVDDCDILPFLIKEPNNPTLVRRFIGSSIGLLCKFCNENRNQVIGRFSENGRLVVTGDHLSTCRPFNLEDNSNSVGCQTDNVEDTSNGTENFEIEGNTLKVNGREYVDSDGDGKMYHCKTCFKKGKTVVEAKLRTVVVEDEHCNECLGCKVPKTEFEEASQTPSRDDKARPDVPVSDTSASQGSARASSCAPSARKSISTPIAKGEKVPQSHWKIVSNGKKNYMLIRSCSDDAEGWEFRSLYEKTDGTVPYLCCDCGKTCFAFDKTSEAVYSILRVHSCKSLPFKILEEKYEDLRAGIKVNQVWWRRKSKEYGERLISRGSGRYN